MVKGLMPFFAGVASFFFNLKFNKTASLKSAKRKGDEIEFWATFVVALDLLEMMSEMQ